MQSHALTEYKQSIQTSEPHSFYHFFETTLTLLEQLAEAVKSNSPTKEINQQKAALAKLLSEIQTIFPTPDFHTKKHCIKDFYNNCQEIIKSDDETDISTFLNKAIYNGYAYSQKIINHALHDCYASPLIKRWLKQENLDNAIAEKIKQNPFAVKRLLEPLQTALNEIDKIRFQDAKKHLQSIATSAKTPLKKRAEKVIKQVDLLYRRNSESLPLRRILQRAATLAIAKKYAELDQLNESLQNQLQNEVTITAYFSGTGHKITDTDCLTGLLHDLTQHSTTQQKIGFDGCGITDGVKGMIFGSGLEKQCAAVKQKILSLIQQGKKVKLNCYGHSRGGVAALLLAKELGTFNKDILEINLALFDTVPGNFITTSRLDILNISLAKQAMDLTKCKNLNKVLSIYTHTPMPVSSAHAPLLPQFPARCTLEQDIICGEHSNAQSQRATGSIVDFDNKSFVTFARIKQFLATCGTRFTTKPQLLVNNNLVTHTRKKLLEIYTQQLNSLKKQQSRKMHAHSAAKITTELGKKHLNLHHKQLDPTPEKDYALKISTKEPFSNPINQTNYLSTKTQKLFNELITAILVNMTTQSKNSDKGMLLAQYANEICQRKNFPDHASLMNALRNVIALALQRDRHAWSLFSTTRSGNTALELLHSPKFAIFSALIQGSATHKLTYSDLRIFVLGKDDNRYFNAKHRQTMYHLLQATTETAAPMKNRVADFLTRK